MTMTQPFRLEQVAEGVWAALVHPGTGALGNAGIVDLGDRTLVIDTFMTPTAATALRAAAAELTGRSAAYVVNTHFHGDHVHGNQVFADAVIIATEATREIMATRMPAYLAQSRESLPKAIRDREEQLARETDPAKRESLEGNLGNNRVLLADLPEMRVTLPAVTFTDRLVLHGSKRTAEVITYGGGHSAGDAFVWLPDAGVAFVGDLVLVGHHLWMGHGYPDTWLTILDRLEQLPMKSLVPGHGPVGTLADIPAAKQYIREMLALVGQLVQDGKTPADAVLPESLRAFKGSPDVFNWNVGTFWERLAKKA